MDTLFQDEGGEGAEILATLLWFTVITVDDESTLQDCYSCFSKVIPSMSVIQYASHFSDRLSSCQYVFGMHVHCFLFMKRDGGAQWLTAAGDWDRRWLH